MSKKHTFHIPVMGIGFTLDTPLKVSPFGMDSVISIVDDRLIERMRKMYCEKFQLPYEAITEKIDDFRAKRITSYLNLINQLADKRMKQLKECADETGKEIKTYFKMLPDGSEIKNQFKELSRKSPNLQELKSWLNDHLTAGSIDVNIMTKLDKANYKKGNQLPSEFNDAHAALRGFAQSDLESSVILSAGMNPRLYSYMENFDDFYPDSQGYIKKKIVIKVSDYRSALIQGKFLAKKGLWVSEYRIESGLNCGGHAFATEGYLMGPILEEFKNNRQDLQQSVHEILIKNLAQKERTVPQEILELKITAQGGVGTKEEHQLLIEHYGIDSVGWGTPFLLVPEATTVDDKTMDMLIAAQEKDLYLSNISPLGVPFNNLRGNTKDQEKMQLIEKGRPGSACPKAYLALNKEFSDRSICTASREYQRKKIKELDALQLEDSEYNGEYEKITDKSCICVGLGSASLQVNNITNTSDKQGVSVCPGPNLAYFSKKMSLKEITDHIYGRIDVIKAAARPNMFMKELKLYTDYLKNSIEESKEELNKKQEKYLLSFTKNLKEGIDYYQELSQQLKEKYNDTKTSLLNELDLHNQEIQRLEAEIQLLLVKV